MPCGKCCYTNEMQPPVIRPEIPADITDIREVVRDAFANHPRSNQTEHLLVDKLREAGALTVSLVAEVDGEVVGHIAFSRVTIDGQDRHWYGLAPVSVTPRFQGKGIGMALVNAGLAALKPLKAAGCVVLGEPEYYSRFGFRADAALVLDGVPPEYFMVLRWGDKSAKGVVAYHEAFSIVG